MKNIVISIILMLLFLQCNTTKKTHSVSKKTTHNYIDRPKLMIGIVVDQMRYDFLIRFYNKYGDGGFKKLMKEGYNCENTHYNYIPTHTAVGHASIFTGTTPDIHGIIGNNWYDKYQKKGVYCVDDANYITIGSKKNKGKSPLKLQSTTITDQLKLAQINEGKVIGISIKDRSAILPTGFSADAAYWFEGNKKANFITSSYYLDELPKWVTDFNTSNIAKSHLKIWNTLYPINTYTESIADDNDFEKPFKGENRPIFPHDLPSLMKKNNNYDLLKVSPFGNSLLVDFAIEAIKGEQLGQSTVTDFLTISFSSPDYVGHQFGPDSKEIQDVYLRLDKDLARFINFLDNEIGKNEYTLFLTADHAVLPVPNYLKSKKIKAHYFDKKGFKKYLNDFVLDEFGANSLIENISNYQIYLNTEKIKQLKLDYIKVVNTIKNYIISFDGIYKVVTAETLQNTNFTTGILNSLQNGYNQKLSGDILVIPTPATISYKEKGSTHGSGYSYDTHVPLLFYGKGIKKGTLKRYIPIIDIAPTLSNLLKIETPSACTGQIIEEVLK